MSHSVERKEKICLNCNANIYGKYCHICGQENIEPKETAWGLFTHFVYDVTHFDGKFFSTLKYLLFKPGFLSYEYSRGRRASYLNPVRMYVFTSAIFFLLFFAFNSSTEETTNENFKAETLQKREVLQKQFANTKDTLQIKQIDNGIKALDEVLRIYNITGMKMDTTDIKEAGNNAGVTAGIFGDSLPESISKYDALQKNLPPSKKDGWFTREVKHKMIALNIKYKGRQKEFLENFKEKFFHSIPQMMFVSLPFVALILSLLYVRRKQFFYVSHLIFIIHVYIAVYILILINSLFGWLQKTSHWGIFNLLSTATVLFIFFYIYKCMRNFYQQRRAKTILKFLLFNFVVLLVFVVLSAGFIITSLLRV